MPEEKAALKTAQVRVAVALALVLSEYLVQAVLFDGGELARRGGWAARVGSLGEVVTGGCIVLTAGVVLARRELCDALRACVSAIRSVSLFWCVAHLVGFGLSALSLGCVFSTKVTSPATVLGLLSIWLLSVVGSTIALGCALFGNGVWRLAVVVVRIALAGLALGSVAWVLAVQSRRLWPWLARQSLSLSAWILSLFTDRVEVDIEHTSFGTAEFYVEIAPQCSGIEGMALVGVFLGGYLYEFRRSLRFPRALLLLPLAVLAAWLANAVRLTALVAVGVWISPEVALGGFHSKAGWMLFCGIALTIVYITQRTSLFSRTAPLRSSETYNPTAAYCIPLLSVLAVSLVTALVATAVDVWYAPRVICATVVLWLYRPYYADLKVKPGWDALLIGAAVFAVWLLLWPGADQVQTARFKAAINGMSPDARLAWIGFRVLGGVAITPIIEELAFRGFLQRRLIDADFTKVSLKQVTLLSLLGSAVVFGGLHQAWIAGTVAGVAYSFACYRRGRLMDAVAAHATTNALIAVWVLTQDRWDLWL